MHKIACIEAGGTKFVCALGDRNGKIYDRVSFKTTTPEETMPQVIEYFSKYKGQFDTISIGTFGPAQVNRQLDNFGSITTTPKLKWQNYNMIDPLYSEFKTRIFFDTDVNAAAAGELKWGAAQGLSSCLYITVGTGIGVGAIINNKLLQGISHPEMGHILIRPHPQDTFKGFCPYHSNCLEGLCAGPAIEKRYNLKAYELAPEHQVWEFISYYLSQALMNYILVLSPKKIILGGGVMKQRHLFPVIRKQTKSLLNNYIQFDEVINNIDSYIVPPKLEDNAGICGTIAMTLL